MYLYFYCSIWSHSFSWLTCSERCRSFLPLPQSLLSFRETHRGQTSSSSSSSSLSVVWSLNNDSNWRNDRNTNLILSLCVKLACPPRPNLFYLPTLPPPRSPAPPPAVVSLWGSTSLLLLCLFNCVTRHVFVVVGQETDSCMSPSDKLTSNQFFAHFVIWLLCCKDDFLNVLDLLVILLKTLFQIRHTIKLLFCLILFVCFLLIKQNNKIHEKQKENSLVITSHGRYNQYPQATANTEELP